MADEQDGTRRQVPSSRRYVLIAAAAIVVAVLVVVIIIVSGSSGGDQANGRHTGSDSSDSSSKGSSLGSSDSSVDTSSASSSATSTTPQSSSTGPSKTSNPPDSTGIPDQPALPPGNGVEVVVTSVEWHSSSQSLEVVAAVTGVTSDSGQCTATATMGSDQASASVNAVFDGRGMSCGSILIPMQGKPAGKWNITVVFTYAGGTAAAAPTEAMTN